MANWFGFKENGFGFQEKAGVWFEEVIWLLTTELCEQRKKYLRIHKQTFVEVKLNK